jgi:hypothetical protein
MTRLFGEPLPEQLIEFTKGLFVDYEPMPDGLGYGRFYLWLLLCDRENAKSRKDR